MSYKSICANARRTTPTATSPPKKALKIVAADPNLRYPLADLLSSYLPIIPPIIPTQTTFYMPRLLPRLPKIHPYLSKAF